MNFCVYILQSLKTLRLYIGQTYDIHARLRRHNKGIVPATRSERPWQIIHIEQYLTRSEAVQRERYLKSLKNQSIS